MTREGREYGRRKREGTDEETDRIVRETIDEMRKEMEEMENPEQRELPEQTYCPEKVVREAIDEVVRETAERQRLKEQQESEKEEPKETKEKVKEIPEEWDVDRCVRETIQEIEIERERLHEEREKAEMEKEEQRDASREVRKETAEKDNLEDYEEEIKKGFEKHGIDPEDLEERWRKKFEEEVKKELGEERESKKETEGKEDDESAGSERAVEGRYYYDDGSGQVYEVQMDSKESSGSETESKTEVEDVQEEPPTKQHENTESKKSSGEIEPEKVTPTQETEDVVEEKSRKEVRPEQEEIPRVENKEIKQEKKETTKESVETPSEEHDEHTPETSQTPEKGREEPSSSPETNTKRKQEGTESEESQDTEENIEENSESREKEIWTEYEVKYGSLEDENYKRALREIKDLLPEEEQEKFNESVREKVQTVEDFKELARKHGLDEILEDEEVMEEIRNYLKVRRTLEQESDTDIEKLAEEMEIDAELAEEWSRGESEPYSLKKLLNLEAYHMLDEIIRNYREQIFPESKDDLESILESDSEHKADTFFELERDDAIAYVEIMAMRRRGEIERRIRNGREVYSRKQIMELSKKYDISVQEIISWLRGEQVHPLVRKISSKKQNQAKTTFKADRQIESKTRTQLETAYSSLYYYFRDGKLFEEYINDVERILGLPQENRKELVKTLQEFAPQLFIEPVYDACINYGLKRIRGDFIALMNSISGKNLSNLDGKISKLTKPSGRGGIKNPRFPEGEKFEVALARLTAIAVSDCHLKPNGTLEYAESEISRIKIVERDLQVWGDITLNPKKRDNENLYLSYFPTPLGVMLMHFGIPSGDKSVQNLGLFPAFNGFSVRAKCALMEDLIPQDGTISGKKVQWTHTNVLDAADKAETYGIRPKVEKREIDFIKNYGKREKQSWVLNYGTLKELRNSKSDKIRNIARFLWKCVHDNPNRLILDQIEVVKSLGIRYQRKPYAIRYHKRTRRVSVAWTAEPVTILESIKLGMIAPPNDVVKKKIVKEIIKNHPKYVEEAISHLGSHEVEVDKWWEDE